MKKVELSETEARLRAISLEDEFKDCLMAIRDSNPRDQDASLKMAFLGGVAAGMAFYQLGRSMEMVEALTKMTETLREENQ